LEQLDYKFTSILLQAESECAIPTQYPWSPELHQKSLIYTYWIIHLKGINNNINVTTQLNIIKDKLTDLDVYQENPQRQSLAQLRLARKNLINFQLGAHHNRDKFLNIQHQIMVDEGKMTQAKAIQHKMYREQQRRCWTLLRSIIHGSKTSGGISHVLTPIQPDPNIPNDYPQYNRIQTKTDMDTTLLTQNVQHFAQADGTPFTRQPLLDIVGKDGCALGALHILEGNQPDNIN
jgi:hypothetical protein